MISSAKPLRRLKYQLLETVRGARMRSRCGDKFQSGKTVLVLFLYADQQKYPHARRYVSELIQGFQGNQVQLIAIDNFHEEKAADKCGSTIEIGGDNSFWEFSGWQKGIRFALDEGLDADVVLLVNDAFLNYRHFGYDLAYYRSVFNSLSVGFGLEGLVGLASEGAAGSELMGLKVDTWIKSNIFMLPFELATQVSLCSINTAIVDEIFPRHFRGSAFLPTAPLNETLRSSLTNWIEDGWQFSNAIDDSNWDFVRSKLIAILNERLLTAQIRELKQPIFSCGRSSIAQGCARFSPCIQET